MIGNVFEYLGEEKRLLGRKSRFAPLNLQNRPQNTSTFSTWPRPMIHIYCAKTLLTAVGNVYGRSKHRSKPIPSILPKPGKSVPEFIKFRYEGMRTMSIGGIAFVEKGCQS